MVGYQPVTVVDRLWHCICSCNPAMSSLWCSCIIQQECIPVSPSGHLSWAAATEVAPVTNYGEHK